MKKFGLQTATAVRTLASVAALVVATAAATGQQATAPAPAQDQSVPDNTGLNIPQNLQVFGKLDPNIRKATAIVNDNVITQTDVDQRVALILAANNVTTALPPEERERLRLQVLRQLIDEVLQIQQAKTADITITPQQIEQSLVRVAKNFNQTPATFNKWLRDRGTSQRSMQRQIEAELAWSRYLRNRVEPFVNVGEEEVKAIMDRMQAAQGTEEFHLSEIYLPATPDQQEQVAANARQLLGEIQKGQAPFAYFARQYSAATTRSVGGDLDWVRASQIPDALAQAAASMQVGQVAGPIPVPGGVSILWLQDKRQVLTADPRDARLSLKQMTIKFPAGATEAQAAARTAEFAKQTQGLQGCGSVEKLASQIGAETVQNDSVRIRDLPTPLQSLLVNMQIGQATPPFGSPSDGVRTLVLCGREDARSGQLPGVAQIQNQLEQQRVNLRAQQAMRDLRRDAVVDYR